MWNVWTQSERQGSWEVTVLTQIVVRNWQVLLQQVKNWCSKCFLDSIVSDGSCLKECTSNYTGECLLSYGTRNLLYSWEFIGYIFERELNLPWKKSGLTTASCHKLGSWRISSLSSVWFGLYFSMLHTPPLPLVSEQILAFELCGAVECFHYLLNRLHQNFKVFISGCSML